MDVLLVSLLDKMEIVFYEDMNKVVDLCCQMEEVCRFCYPPEKERILYTTEHFYVMVSLGPIVEGYLLIISKEHIGSCLHLPAEYWDEFKALKEKVRQILVKVYGSCIFYEHGKMGSCILEGMDHIHCYHAHLHCKPAKVELNLRIEKEIAGTCYGSLDECFNKKEELDRYLFVEDERIMTYQPDFKLRRQYLRYMLATSLDCEDRWDWVENQNWELIEKTIVRLKPHFDEKSVLQ